MWLKDLVSSKFIRQNYEIDNITHLVDNVNEKSVFVCLLKEEVVVKKLVKKAIKNGAKLIVSTFYIDDNINYIVVEDIRCFYAKICSKLYNLEKVKAKIIGVVGTNGKTSTVKMLNYLLKSCGKKVGAITTGKAFINNVEIKTNMTTPDPPELYKIIELMDKKGAEYILMEVSAHSIFYKKCAPIKFEYLLFTNFSQDHLDFFESLDNYKNVKKSIFLGDNAKNIIVNSDDVLGVEILQQKDAISYGLYNPADVFAINIKEEKNNCKFVLNAFDDIKIVNLNMVGLFNVYNYLGCISLCLTEGLLLEDLVCNANKMPSISGRLEYLGKKIGDVYLDYAHTPIGLKTVLVALRKICKNKLYCLFGCGGNRDKSKREIMGQISAEFADFTIITSDNPRFEEPFEIIKQIEKGVKKINKNYITIQDRSFAVKYAIDSLKEGDILVVAGKGDEEYQEIMGEKHYYSDKKLIKSIIDK